MKFLNQSHRAIIETETPAYIYDHATLLQNFLDLRSALPENFEILYSMKANPHPKILESLKKIGAAIDVASLNELNLSQRAGFLPSDVSYVGPGKRDVELQAIVSRGVAFPVVESLTELERINFYAAEQGKTVEVCIRLNPFSELSYQFGMDFELKAEILRTVYSCRNIKLVGTHFYIKSHYLDSKQLLKNFERFYQVAIDFERDYGKPFKMVNFGGGFGIPYFSGQNELDLNELSQGLGNLHRDHISQGLKECRFFVESGRFLSARCGVYVVKVLYRKVSHGRIFLICDGGMSTHQAATGVGQVLRRNYELTLWPQDKLRPTSHSPLEVVTIAGPSCYSLDLLATDVKLPHAEPGDLICIWNSGAYGKTFSPESFLLLPKAREFFLQEGELS